MYCVIWRRRWRPSWRLGAGQSFPASCATKRRMCWPPTPPPDSRWTCAKTKASGPASCCARQVRKARSDHGAALCFRGETARHARDDRRSRPPPPDQGIAACTGGGDSSLRRRRHSHRGAHRIRGQIVGRHRPWRALSGARSPLLDHPAAVAAAGRAHGFHRAENHRTRRSTHRARAQRVRHGEAAQHAQAALANHRRGSGPTVWPRRRPRHRRLHRTPPRPCAICGQGRRTLHAVGGTAHARFPRRTRRWPDRGRAPGRRRCR